MLDTNTQMRLTGLASGIDTDAIIQNLGKAHNVRINAVKKDRQLLLWRQEAYRSTINLASSFLKSSFNAANPAGNFRSATAFAKFSYNLSMGSTITEAAKTRAASILSVTANGDLKNFNQTVESVAQLATKDKWTGSSVNLAGITTKNFDIEKFGNQSGNGWTSTGAAFTVSIDGISRTVVLNGSELQNIYANNGQYEGVSGNGVSNAGTIDTGNLGKYFVTAGNKNVNAQEYFDSLLAEHFGTTGITSLNQILGNPAISGLVNVDNNNGTITFTPGSVDLSALGLDSDAINFLNELANQPIQLKEQSIDLDNNYLYFVDNNSAGHYASVSSYLKNAGLTDSQIDDLKANGGFNPYMSVSDLEAIVGPVDDTDSKITNALKNLQSAPLFTQNTNANPNAAAEAFANLVNSKIETLFGKDYKDFASAKNGEITFNRPGSTVIISEAFGNRPELAAMGLSGGATSSAGLKKVTEILDWNKVFGSGGTGNIEINGKSVSISATDTLSSVMSKINSSGAGVNLSYDAAGDRFVLTSTQEGSANNINMITGDAAKFFESLGIGKAAEVEYNTGNGTGTSSLLIIGDSGLGGLEDALSTLRDANLVGVANKLTITDKNGNKHVFEKDVSDGSFKHYTNFDANGENPSTSETLTLAQIKDLGLIGDGSGSREEGQNLIAMINGEKYVKQTNSFTHEGMNFNITATFNEARYDSVTGKFFTDAQVRSGNAADGNGNVVDLSQLEDVIKIQVNKNTGDLVESIKSFVEEYNKLIDHVNGLLTEKRDRSYAPLTEDEKSAMSEKDVELYEVKAKTGLMTSDSDLRKLLDQMRSAIYQKVEGVGLTMSEIGITTTSNWKDGGRLVIDEEKLASAIDNRYDDVVALFTKAETKDANGKIIQSGGIAQRLNQVLNDAVGTTGEKGYLVNKAGTVNDATQYQNQIQKKLDDYDKRLDTLLERWYRQEDQYYKMFSRMETAMMKMQSQQNSLASLMAQSGG